MSQMIKLRVRGGATIAAQDAGVALVTGPRGTLTLKQVTPPLHAALATLFAGGASMDDLRSSVMEAEGPGGLFKLTHYIKTFGKADLLTYAVTATGGDLATLEPMGERFRFASSLPNPSAPMLLSRFAWCRRDRDRWIVESPLGYAQLALAPAAAGIVGALARPGSLDDLGAAVPALSREQVEAVMVLLANTGALVPIGDDGRAEEERDPDLQPWEFHDFLFHTRSRLGRHDHPYGGTFRFVGTLPPAPGVKPAMTGAVIPLPKPDLEERARTDKPFGAVMEERRSIRDMAEQPLTIAQLGEFLYRSARVKKLWHTDKGDVTQRPYPGGGALYELEIYPIVDRCDGLDSAVYHYDPLNHALERIAERDVRMESLLTTAWHTADRRSKPQIVFAITARFARLQWKYQSMVYAAVLKHVGVLYQTFYLTATAMGLAPCALGGGDSDLFGEIAGLEYAAESAVGEFILGSRAEGIGSRFDRFDQ